MIDEKSLVSVIVTTKNTEKVIVRLLKSLKKQSYKNIEILVVDNASTDATFSIAKKFTSFVYSYGPERSAQRNYGGKKAKGKYFLFLDADMELTKDVIASCVKKIETGKKIGAVIIPEKSIAIRFWEKVKAFERSFYNEEGDAITDAARFFTRKAFDFAGGYDESITGPEDWDLPEQVRKNGFLIERITDEIYHYENITSPFDIARKKFYYGLRSHRYLKKNNIAVLSAKTIYFLRPVFYKQWRKLISHPLLSMSMILMLLCELIGGGLGFFTGKFKKI